MFRNTTTVSRSLVRNKVAKITSRGVPKQSVKWTVTRCLIYCWYRSPSASFLSFYCLLFLFLNYSVRGLQKYYRHTSKRTFLLWIYFKSIASIKYYWTPENCRTLAPTSPQLGLRPHSPYPLNSIAQSHENIKFAQVTWHGVLEWCKWVNTETSWYIYK